jgi:hypothetical protein
MEALACSIDHPSVRKFYAIHAQTMEAYQLWWNRSTFQEMLIWPKSTFGQNQSLVNQELLQGGGLDSESQHPLVTFKQTWVRLAWAFLCIMNAIQQSRTLHNDLSQEDIMLCFLANKLSNVYIGVCDWGEMRKLGEDNPSPYGYATKKDTTTQWHFRWWVALKFFIPT